MESGYLHECLRILLRPLVRFCLRWSIGIQDWMEASKQVFIDVAREEMEKDGAKVNVSRLSVATGLRRREVIRIYREGEEKEPNFSFVTRVIGQWQHDPDFLTKAGKARVLGVEGEDNEFYELVRTVSSDLHPGTVLFELERIGAVQRTSKGLKLVSDTYSPNHDVREGFTMLARDTEDLMVAAQENLLDLTEYPNLHHTTEYDNVREDALPKISEWIFKEGEKFHTRARKFISQFDLDVSKSKRKSAKNSSEKGVRVSLTSFNRIDPSSHID